MRIVVNIMLTALLLFVGGCGSGRAESHFRTGYNFGMLDSVAVVAVEGAVKSEAARNQIAEYFEMELLKKGYAPKEWTNVAAALKEQELNSAELNTDEGVAEAGKIVNVPAVMIVNVPHFGDEIFINAKLVDVADGSVLWIGSGTSRSGSLFGLGSDWGSGGAMGGENDLFGVSGGMMGGMSNFALSPKQSDQLQRLIRRMCRTLPSRLTTEW
ncbi:MAG: hypothetical protein JW837_04200 [Sedimentisphaerales bacterium]|nr:hypothetical protein [Sedimentisphaerales bacterium]